MLALLAAAAVFIYTATADRRAIVNLSPVGVVVSVETIPTGVTLQQAIDLGLARETKVPLKARPLGAIETVSDINQNLLAITDVAPGQILLQANFSNEVPQLGPLTIPKGLVAITVQLGDPAHVANFVVPGSEVVVFNTADMPVGNSTQKRTGVVLPRLLVIAVGAATRDSEATTDATGATTQANNTALLTLAVSPADSVKLVQSIQTGSLYMGLLSPEATVISGKTVGNTNVFK